LSFISKWFNAGIERAAVKAEERQKIQRPGWYRVQDLYVKKGNSITEYWVVLDPTPLPGDPPAGGEPAP
jgi:hypothetical protein